MTSHSPGYDVVAILGQSNAAGAALDGNDERDSRVFQWAGSGPTEGSIIEASEPLLHPWRADYGFGVTFGKKYADARLVNTDRRVLLVPVAKSGTTLRPDAKHGQYVWKPGWVPPEDGVNLVDLAVESIGAALLAAGPNSRLVAILWHHGESDGLINTTRADYAAGVRDIITALRTRIVGGENAPFVMAQMVPEGIVDVPGRIQTHYGALEVSESMPHCAFAYSPRRAYRTYQGRPDTTHFNAAGQREIASRLLAALTRAEGGQASVTLYSTLGLHPDPGPELRARTFVERVQRRLVAEYAKVLSRSVTTG